MAWDLWLLANPKKCVASVAFQSAQCHMGPSNQILSIYIKKFLFFKKMKRTFVKNSSKPNVDYISNKTTKDH